MAGFTDDEDALIIRLWNEGDTTVEIGRHLRRSKNSIIGRAHRLGLSRPSPIGQMLRSELPQFVERRQAVAALSSEGYTPSDIMEKLGLSRSQLQTARQPGRGTHRLSRAIRSGPVTLKPLPALVTPLPTPEPLQATPVMAPKQRWCKDCGALVTPPQKCDCERLPPSKAPELIDKPPRPAPSGRKCQFPQEPWRRPWPMCGAAVASAWRNGQVVELPYCRVCAKKGQCYTCHTKLLGV